MLAASLLISFLSLPSWANGANSCPTLCFQSNPKYLTTQIGWTKEYEYKSEFVAVSSRDNITSSTKVEATALVTQINKCQHVLRIQNLKFTGANIDVQVDFVGVNSPVRFNYNDGQVGGTLCTTASETSNSLNFKRAVISLLQFGSKNQVETDISGACPLQEAVEQTSAGSYKFIKVKNYKRCVNGEITDAYFVPNSFSSEVLEANVGRTEVLVQNGVLRSTKFNQKIVPVGLVAEEVVPDFQVSASLVFKTSVSGGAIADVTTVPKQIQFEYVMHYVDSGAVYIAEVVQQEPLDLKKLINVLRASSEDEIGGAIQILNGTFTTIVYDALLKSCTKSSLAALLAFGSTLQPPSHTSFLDSMTFCTTTSADSATYASNLLDNPNLPPRTVFSVATHIENYSRSARPNWGIVNSVIKKFLGMLGSSDTSTAMIALKALPNLGFLNSATVTKVVSIAEDKTSSAALRVEALATCLTEAANWNVRSSARRIFEDGAESYQVRLQAFFVVAAAPNARAVASINRVLGSSSAGLQNAIYTYIEAALASDDNGNEKIKFYLSKVQKRPANSTTVASLPVYPSAKIYGNWNAQAGVQPLVEIHNPASASNGTVEINVYTGLKLFGKNFDFSSLKRTIPSQADCDSDFLNVNEESDNQSNAFDFELIFPSPLGFIIRIITRASVSLRVTSKSSFDGGNALSPTKLSSSLVYGLDITKNVQLCAEYFAAGMETSVEYRNGMWTKNSFLVDEQGVTLGDPNYSQTAGTTIVTQSSKYTAH